ncbi:putative receptor protein kinase CRINKLY4 [Senna tora]|uniref:Putative receptor protein kinase CRINKLY4 n=1 Tax=Senna tora TaxID=362788 RepID=A0A834T872_9FABA|nr:putative receptor protein kinase CRINKLY4 [Senna tora]
MLGLTAQKPSSPSGLTAQQIGLQNGEIEISEFGISVGVEEYVGGLDISVDNRGFPSAEEDDGSGVRKLGTPRKRTNPSSLRAEPPYRSAKGLHSSGEDE